jgi:hypothetical protein
MDGSEELFGPTSARRMVPGATGERQPQEQSQSGSGKLWLSDCPEEQRTGE